MTGDQLMNGLAVDRQFLAVIVFLEIGRWQPGSHQHFIALTQGNLKCSSELQYQVSLRAGTAGFNKRKMAG